MISTLVLRVVLQAGAVLGLMLLSAGLFGRPFCFRRQMTVREARMTLASDFLVWSGAVVMVVAHAGLWFFSKGLGTWLDFANPFQIAQIAVFVLILGLDVWPAKVFRSWVRYLVLDQVPYFTDREYFRIRWIWRIQAALLVSLPAFSPLVRLGIGLSR